MALKETIAIAGATGKAGSVIAYKLAANHYRLLLISTDSSKLIKLSEDIKRTTANAEAEVIDCLKDGCWEADIIVLAVPAEAEHVIAEKIKEVATQKIVVHIVSNKNNSSFPATYIQRLQQLLPNSKIVNALINTAGLQETVIAGNDQEAVATIVNIATKAGFNAVTATEL